jgi:hypothetical protein
MIARRMTHNKTQGLKSGRDARCSVMFCETYYHKCNGSQS